MTDQAPTFPRVLIFAAAFAPRCFSEGLVNSKLALAMRNRGWDIDVISAAGGIGPAYQPGWIAPWVPLKTVRHEIETVSGATGLRRILGLSLAVATTGHPVRGIHWARLAYRKALEMHQAKPYDLVISRSTSCSAHLPALMFKKKTGMPWIANWNDPPPYLFPPPYTYKLPFFRRLMTRRYYRAVAESADFNTFPTQRLFEHMKAELDLQDEHRVRILPHIALDGYKTQLWKKRETLKFCHAGNLSKERRPDLFLQAYGEIVRRYAGSVTISLEIVGLEDTNLECLIEGLKLQQSVGFTGAKTFQDTLESISLSDIAVLIEAPCENGIFLPSKVVDYAQSGRPILAISPNSGVMRDLLAQNGGGIWADNRSRESIMAALDKLVQLWMGGRLNTLDPLKLAEMASPNHILDAHLAMMKAESPMKAQTIE